MNKQYYSYEDVTDKTIMDVKMYLLMIGSGAYENKLHNIINHSVDSYYIRKNIHKNRDVEIWLFSKIKKLIDSSTEFRTIEKHLVFMNIIFDKNFKPLYDYKYNLFRQIINNGFNIANYCLLRHLIDYKPRILESFVEYACDEANTNTNQYHYLASYIFLLEREYHKAYKHLGYIELDQDISRFNKALYNYNPLKFHKLTNKKMKLREAYN